MAVALDPLRLRDIPPYAHRDVGGGHALIRPATAGRHGAPGVALSRRTRPMQRSTSMTALIAASGLLGVFGGRFKTHR